jgi:hypothetical protein
MKTLILSVIFSLLSGIVALAQNLTSPEQDKEAVKAACYDYINAFYQADTTLAYRSVHPQVQKRGFWFNDKKNEYAKMGEMPFNRLIALAKVWNKDGKEANAQSPKKVEVFEVSDKTAVAKVIAVWGIDYMHLAKIDNKWYIMNVLWQSPPKFSNRYDN